MDKTCNICHETQEITNFYTNPHQRHGYADRCKKCDLKVNKEWRKAHGSQVSEWQRKRRQRNPDKMHGYYLKYEYGITIDQYNQMLKDQNNVCAICSKTQISNRRLSVDHCHETGNVRGLLCTKCNNAIGQLKTPALLDRAKRYLENTK
jgi:hypothetical protein